MVLKTLTIFGRETSVEIDDEATVLLLAERDTSLKGDAAIAAFLEKHGKDVKKENSGPFDGAGDGTSTRRITGGNQDDPAARRHRLFAEIDGMRRHQGSGLDAVTASVRRVVEKVAVDEATAKVVSDRVRKVYAWGMILAGTYLALTGDWYAFFGILAGALGVAVLVRAYAETNAREVRKRPFA
jgi:hypothetical protein